MLKAENISKTFHSEGVETHALRDVSLEVKRGDFVSIVGRSGSGKTTLLNILSTLLDPDEGSIFYKDIEVTGLPQKELNLLRQKDFGIVFQFHHLLPYLTARENVLLPYMNSLRSVPADVAARADECLERVGLHGKGNKLPSHLSGGEQQRVAIARALAKECAVLFADEPTGNLDKETGGTIIELLSELRYDGLGIVMVTHDTEYASLADRTIHMADGVIV
ncbi:MAG: ABC transporter ATP-binding protein [Desulfovibrio sp.]